MRVKQISVFIENKAGSLSDVCGVLADSGINLRALSIADTRDFGILRIIVEDPERATEILRSAGYACKTTYVIAVEIEDAPGGMAKAIRTITDAGIEIEYAYAFVSHKQGSAYMIFRMSHSEESEKKLEGAGLSLVSSEQLFG